MPRPFTSKLSRRIPILDDQTRIDSVVPPDVYRGYKSPPVGYSAFDSPYAIGFEAAGIETYDRTEWPERTEELVRTKTLISDVVKAAGYKIKMQSRTNYCHFFGSVSVMEARHILQGGKHVELSPASGAAPMTGFRNVGGWASQDLKWIAQHGVVPTSLWPQAAISKQYYTDASKATARRFRVLRFVPLDSFDELYSCLLQRIPVTHASMRWRHLVAAFDPVVRGRRSFGVGIANSWDVTWGERGYGVLDESFGFSELIAVLDVTPYFWEG